MSTSWTTQPGLLENRLDAEFYLPKYLSLIAKIRSSANPQQLGQVEIDGSYGTLPQSEEYGRGSTPLIRGKDLDGQAITEVPGDAPLVPDTYLRRGRARMKPREVLLLVKGATIDAPQSVGVVSEGWSTPAIVNGSIYKFSVCEPNDPYYLCAFFGTQYGRDQKTRAIANTGINYNDQGAIRAFWVALPESGVQHAIGNKVRKAERLRELADHGRARVDAWVSHSASQTELADKDERFLDHFPASTIPDSRWVADVSTADRVDPWPHHIAPMTIRRHLKHHARYRRLKDIADSATQQRGRMEFSNPAVPGYFVSVLDLDFAGRIDWDNASRSRYAGNGIPIKANDVLYSCLNPQQPRVGAVPAHRTGTMVSSPEFAVLRSKTGDSGHPYLLSAALRSRWVRVQASFLTRSSSLSRRRLDEADLGGILVPWSDDALDDLEASARNAIENLDAAVNLVAQARTAVESLIDGTLDESALLAEGKAIEQWLAENPSPRQQE